MLYQLVWGVDIMMRPTWRNLESSFESWAYGNGLLRQIQRLEAQAFLETRRDAQSGKRVMRLTEKGLTAGQVGADPEPRWQRSWDGTWRVILFDLPEEQREVRRKLRQKLFTAGFGCMQRSAWLSPDPVDHLAVELRPLAVNAAKLVLLEASPCAGETPADMVQAAWDFKRIDEAWHKLDAHLAAVPDPADPDAQEPMVRWIAKERQLLQRCFQHDPFLPKQLLPTHYPGRITWQRRCHLLRQLAHHPA